MFPSYISGVHHLGWDFCVCDFFNPTIEVVTFCLHGWCIMGVFLLPAFIRLGHKCQDPLSLCTHAWNACVHLCTQAFHACVHRLDLSLYSHPKEFWGNGVRTHVNSKGKISSTGKIFFRRGSNPRHCIKQDSEPNAQPSYFAVGGMCNGKAEDFTTFWVLGKNLFWFNPI